MDNLVNSLVTKTIGLTDQQVKDNLLASPNMNDSQMVQFMQTNGVSPSQMSKVSGIPEGKISARVAATIPYGSSATLGDTIIVPQYRVTGSGETQEIGALEGFASSKTTGDPNYKAPVGTPMQIYNADGEFTGTVKTKKDQSFFGGLVDALKDPYVQAAILGVAGGAGAFDSLLSGTGAAGTGAGSAFEALNAGAGAFEGGTALNSLAGTGAGSTFEALNAGSTAMSDLGASELLNAGASANTIGGTTVANAANAATAAGTTTAAANAAKAGVLGLTTADALALQAGGTLLGTAVNKNAVNDVSGIIKEAGVTGQKTLSDVYQNQKDLNTANNLALANNYSNLNTSLNNNLASQVGAYNTANTGIKNNATTQLGLLASTYNDQKTQAANNAAALNATYGTTLANLGKVYDQQVAFHQPYQAVGRTGSEGLIANKDYFNKQFGTADLNTELAPNYAFQLGQGQMANQRTANMGGGSIGGNALQGLQKYTQDYAGNAYQQAFKNFQDQRQSIYDRLAGMANIGVTSAGQLASLGNTYGSNMSSLSSNLGSNLTANTGNLINAGNVYGSNTSGVTNNLNNVLSSNLGQLQGAYNQYGSNLTGASNTYGGNLTTATGQIMNAGNVYGTNATGLTTGLAAANSTNTLAGANLTGTALNSLGNTALIGSLIKAT